MKTSSAVPRSRSDKSELSDRVEPGSRISAIATVTKTQTFSKINFIGGGQALLTTIAIVLIRS
jgi:hypothetical protein